MLLINLGGNMFHEIGAAIRDTMVPANTIYKVTYQENLTEKTGGFTFGPLGRGKGGDQIEKIRKVYQSLYESLNSGELVLRSTIISCKKGQVLRLRFKSRDKAQIKIPLYASFNQGFFTVYLRFASQLAQLEPFSKDNQVLNFLETFPLTIKLTPSPLERLHVKAVDPCYQIELYSVPSNLSNNFYKAFHLETILGTIKLLTSLIAPSDLLICPGRSAIHFANGLKILGTIDSRWRREVYCPAFSKGGFTISDYRNEIRKEFIYVSNERIEEFKQEMVEIQQKELNPNEMVTYLENRAVYFYDCKSKEVKLIKDLEFKKEQLIAYRRYLKDQVGLTPSILKRTKGKIVLFDTLCSGISLLGFINILRDWSLELGFDISHRLAVLDFNWRVSKNVTELFQKSNIPVSRLIANYDVWCDFSYNYIPDTSFFFPPWAWEDSSIVNQPISENGLKGFQELEECINKLTL
ncbi:MAG: hypothetical protein K0S74_1623 [Chlamydiales bacterium]|jgi:hypothetical protein|nr:hypothetical protein [Chlamydiales bacterium]